MKERPIIFSAPMVRALLAGTKTQTRRVVKPQPHKDRLHRSVDSPDKFVCAGEHTWWSGNHTQSIYHSARCPYGQPGDRLWVQEAWRAELTWNTTKPSGIPDEAALWYEADDQQRNNGRGTKFKGKLRSSIHMPRAASRITLEITSVRVERLQDITIEDAKAEGAWGPDASIVDKVAEHFGIDMFSANPRNAFQMLWEQINGPSSWATNPWVWVVEFKAIEAKP